jgi:hypothetical protein
VARPRRPSLRSPATQAARGCSSASASSLAGESSVALGRSHRRRQSRLKPAFWRGVVLLAVAGLAAFWAWALFFASKEAVNKIGDRDWAERAERICAAAQAQRSELVDERRLDADDPAMLAERATIVDEATDIVEAMLDDVVVAVPDDEKGRALVPLWEADYRTYLENRRQFTERLRAGSDEPFTEAAVDGIPISEKLEQFASDNEMPSCAPPRDLAN